MLYRSSTDLIGSTPMLELSLNLPGRVLVKLEAFNPGGSAKDRVALAMVLAAEKAGKLAPGGLIIEPTSGNTGIGLCAVAAARGYRCIIVMPDSMSVERQLLMKAYGARLVLTPGAGGMSAAIAEAERIAAQNPSSIIAGQFVNPANPQAHYDTTGPEIWADTQGNVDCFFAGVGTGGTVTGVGRFLKEKNPQVKIVAIEPADSPLLSQGKAGPHGIQGIGANFVPQILDRKVIDQVVTVELEEALTAARDLGKHQGILCGISGGAALHAALREAAKEENRGKTLVALLPDSGERYLSAGLY